MELHEYNAAALKLIADSLFPRTIAQENEELHDRAPLDGMKEIMRIASYADDLSQAEILDGMRSIERIAEQTLAQYPLPHEEEPA